MKTPTPKPTIWARAVRVLANVQSFLDQSLTTPGDGVKKFTPSFTVTAQAKQDTPRRQQNMAIQQAGSKPAPWQEKGITPEQQMDTSLYPSPEPTAATLPAPGETLRQPIKTDSEVSQQRVQQYLLARFNPIRGLSPRLLSTYLEQYDLGFLRSMALVWNKIKERDDSISAVTESREVKPADMAWEIIQDEETPEAEAHKKALEEFYNGLSCTHALEQNQRGSTQLMLKMMMKAVGDKFAAFEVIWRPEPDGRLTAELKFIPLWFFENRTGQLRFLPYELSLQGLPLEPGGWMVHVGKGLFAATSVAYIYKQIGLKTWVTYQEKFGIPFLHAKTNADYQSTEWEGLVQAVQNFGSDGGMVTKTTTELEAIIMGSQGAMPHEPFCDRMDRAIARIWRGGDLSSMSKGGGGGASSSGGVGALPQMENESALAKTDAEMLSETCQFYLDRWVIRYKFGENVSPKAKFVLQPPLQVDTAKEIQVDTFLLQAGVPLAVSDLIDRYGRNLPDEGDALAQAPAGRTPGSGFGSAPGGDPASAGVDGLGNVAPSMRRYSNTAAQLQAKAMAKALAPLRTELIRVAAIEDPAERKVALEHVRKTLPAYVRKGISTEVVKTIEDSLATAVVIGATDAAAATGHMHTRPRFPVNGLETHHH